MRHNSEIRKGYEGSQVEVDGVLGQYGRGFYSTEQTKDKRPGERTRRMWANNVIADVRGLGVLADKVKSRDLVTVVLGS